MRTLVLSVCLAFAFFVASAVAQTAPNAGSPGTQNSSPTMQQPNQQPGQAPGVDQQPTADQNTNTQSHNNGEHKIKGCVESQGGQYMLATKKGKDIPLTGQDVSAHAGHEVALTGTWEKNNGMSSASTGNAGASSKTFNVTEVKMISETCKGKTSGNMGNSGTTQSSPNSGTGTQQPPQ